MFSKSQEINKLQTFYKHFQAIPINKFLIKKKENKEKFLGKFKNIIRD